MLASRVWIPFNLIVLAALFGVRIDDILVTTNS